MEEERVRLDGGGTRGIAERGLLEAAISRVRAVVGVMVVSERGWRV